MRTNVPGGIRVVAVAGGEVLDLGTLAHGEHPELVLHQHGWRSTAPLGAELASDGTLAVSYLVTPAAGLRPERVATRRDPGVSADEVGALHQRVAAYALVTSERGVLLTQFTSATHVAGEWGLPGGGLDAGEAPAEAVHREVWEETGQRIELEPLLAVQSSHWVGRAPSGVLEDFHAVRIVYRASCPDPVDPVVHDVGGTTSDARWVAFPDIGDLPLTRSWQTLEALAGLGAAPT